MPQIRRARRKTIVKITGTKVHPFTRGPSSPKQNVKRRPRLFIYCGPKIPDVNEETKELLIYIVFVTSFSYMLFSETTPTACYESIMLRNTLLSTSPTLGMTFESIESSTSFYKWMSETIPYLFEYKGNTSGLMGRGYYIMGVNRVLGSMRVRQVRVGHDGCASVPTQLLENTSARCYPR